MKLKDIVDAVQHGIDLLKGEQTEDRVFRSEHTHSEERLARETLAQAKERLFAVDRWSDVSSLSASFLLHDSAGNPKPGSPPAVGDYIKIVLPGAHLENWVNVTEVINDENLAQFTARPCADPHEKGQQTDHFFTNESTSTFRVELRGNTVWGSQIGKNERANNQEQSGDRAVINTVVAGSGWLFYQKIQWKTLTDYFVGL